MVAGILGGSGTHVVQIIIGIVVAVALIGYFLLLGLTQHRGGGQEAFDETRVGLGPARALLRSIGGSGE
jgi:hypothetical protein